MLKDEKFDILFIISLKKKFYVKFFIHPNVLVFKLQINILTSYMNILALSATHLLK